MDKMTVEIQQLRAETCCGIRSMSNGKLLAESKKNNIKNGTIIFPDVIDYGERGIVRAFHKDEGILGEVGFVANGENPIIITIPTDFFINLLCSIGSDV